MRFEYEITADDYVAGQILYHQRSGGRKHIERAVGWCLVGLFFIVVAWNERALNWAPILLAAVGARWIYAGIANVFPARHFRRFYKGSEMAGKRFRADVGEDGIEVADDVCSRKVRWLGVKLNGENEHIFVFYAPDTIFMFGKKST